MTFDPRAAVSESTQYIVVEVVHIKCYMGALSIAATTNTMLSCWFEFQLQRELW